VVTALIQGKGEARSVLRVLRDEPSEGRGRDRGEEGGEKEEEEEREERKEQRKKEKESWSEMMR
jgi:hypothetical protein